MTAGARWAQALQEWALPEEVLAAAPESPWGFPVSVFLDTARRALSDPLTPTHERVAEALPPDGVVLDVGAGTGAASLPVASRASRIVAVDQDQAMLDAMVELAAGEVEVDRVAGRWPDVAGRVGVVDVVVCANVAYNVADLGPFVVALTAAARHRVVLELSERHPQSPLSPLWERFWDLHRPERPTADDAMEVVREATGERPVAQRWQRRRPFMGDRDAETVAWVRRRLCLGADRDADVAAAIHEMPELAPTSMVTLWWPGAAAVG